MGLIATTSAEATALQGLHLYHFAFSNCSQRVRLALAEKGLAWTSHHVDLLADEHMTPQYQAINPNGVVPTLVHDGQVVIESNDIIAYLDERFPQPPLTPAAAPAAAAMTALVDAASAIQPAVKVLSHELLFRPIRRIDAAAVAVFRARHNDPHLVEFMADYAENGPRWKARFDAGDAAMRAALTRLDTVLGGQPWLSGDAYGLADVSWTVNAHRVRYLQQAGYALPPMPHLWAWYERVRARPSFTPAITEWEPKP